MKKSIIKNSCYFILFLFVGVLSSCQQTLNMDYQHVDPRLVIDAFITDNKPCMVLLTKTEDFGTSAYPQPLQGAQITLTDNEGNTDQLSYTDKGYYISGMIGKVNNAYKLNVLFEGKMYEAKATIPDYVPVDSIDIWNMDIGKDPIYKPRVYYDDPKGIKNYYYVNLQVNGKYMRTFDLHEDKFDDGVKDIQWLLPYNKDENDDKDLAMGDTIQVNFETLDKGAYDFLNTSKSSSGNTNGSNPISNFTGDVLGMFKAYALSQKSVVITPDIIHTKD